MAPLSLKERRQAIIKLVARQLITIAQSSAAVQQQERRSIHRGGYLAALRHVDLLLKGSDKQFHELFRLHKQQFWQLLNWLEENTDLADTQYQTSAQKLLIFLWISAFGEPQRNAAHRFLCAQSTVSVVFQTVLKAMQKLYQTFVKQPDANYLSPEVELQLAAKFEGFSGCIGAIDGTLINAHIPEKQQPAFRSRKGPPSQNVFAAVRFDTAFSYVLAGGEGSIHDNRLLREALSRSFRLPEARFYTADAGFGQRRGIVLPYPNTRYHLKEWKDGGRRPETPEELYNLRHARVRNVVERTFGIVKRKWKILRSSPPEYGLKTQIRIVYAICGLHTFLVLGGAEPSANADAELDSLTAPNRAFLEAVRQQLATRIGTKDSGEVRLQITNQIWPSYLARSADSESSSESETSDSGYSSV
jgi:hypothetical protein